MIKTRQYSSARCYAGVFNGEGRGTSAVAAASTDGPCTRWSASDCGNLDGFLNPILAGDEQYQVDQ